uniref:Putative secreted peptide n=1 Tax=Anopheles braziliensis TaxID=58242 RepID=A0A2M3ZW71_9DIPT
MRLRYWSTFSIWFERWNMFFTSLSAAWRASCCIWSRFISGKSVVSWSNNKLRSPGHGIKFFPARTLTLAGKGSLRCY